MQVSIETTSGLERRLIIGVPAERIDKQVVERLKKAAGNVRIDGFRPGKVPLKVLKQRFGAGVRQEVIGEVMSETFYEAVTKEKLRPAGQPSIEPKNMREGSDLEYVATFEVFPEIELKDVSSITIEKPIATVTDSDVNETIETFRKQKGTWEAVDRGAKTGDQVTMDYVGTKEGEAFAGGTAEKQNLVLGSGQMIPGFEEGLTGASAGEERVLALTFPEDYHAEELKGAAVEFTVKVTVVAQQVLAELTDEFFTEYGVNEGGVDAFREEVRKNMERELKNAAKNKVKSQVMDALLDLHADIQVPNALIAQEIQALRGQMVQQFGGAADKLDVKSLLPDDMFSEQAGRRVRLGLLLNELISKHELKADADKIRAAVDEIASTYEDADEVIQYYYGNQQLLQQVESMVLEEEAIEVLLNSAKLTEKQAEYKDVVAQ